MLKFYIYYFPFYFVITSLKKLQNRNKFQIAIQNTINILKICEKTKKKTQKSIKQFLWTSPNLLQTDVNKTPQLQNKRSPKNFKARFFMF